MAKLLRTAKIASDWTDHDLRAYNVRIMLQSPDQFFGAAAVGVSLAGLDPLIITGSTDSPNISDETHSYLTFLGLATNATQESFLDEFSRRTLEVLGYSARGTVLTTRYNIPLSICRDLKNAQMDVCLLDTRSTILLILQEDKTVFNLKDPEPQVVAEAIAAYRHNNMKRDRRELPALEKMIFPCITMVGTRPNLYLIPVTRELSEAVSSGECPDAQTEVWKCTTAVGRNRSLSEGMDRPEYRRGPRTLCRV